MRAAMTPAEKRLWWALRHRIELQGTHFRRQVAIGPISPTSAVWGVAW